MDDMMAIDARGGMGKPGGFNLASASSTLAAPASITDPGRKYVASMCSVTPWQQTIRRELEQSYS
jgi:cytochrome o ubiquinol oxidase subunit 2